MKLLRVSLLAAVTVTGGFLLSACTLQSQQQQMLNGQQSFEQQDYAKAFKDLKPLAEKGNADAQYALGYMYYYGKGTPKNLKQAMIWMNKAAQQGQPLAQQALHAIQKAPPAGTKPQFSTASSQYNNNPNANTAANTTMPNYPKN